MSTKKPSISDIAADEPGPDEPDRLIQDEEDDLERERAKLENKDLALDISLKKMVARGALWLAGLSIAATFVVISVSAACDGFTVPTSVQNVLISGVVVETVGILRYVTIYLFPRR